MKKVNTETITKTPMTVVMIKTDISKHLIILKVSFSLHLYFSYYFLLMCSQSHLFDLCPWFEEIASSF